MQPDPQSEFVEEQLATLTILGQGQISLRSVASLLSCLDDLHRRFQSLDTLYILVRQRKPIPIAGEPLRILIEAATTNLELPRLESVELHSPGFWEILGSLSPLKFISDCLTFWHERSKDTAFRNAAESARLCLENELRINDVIRQRLDLLRSVGVSDAELRQHFVQPVLGSVTKLYEGVQLGVIDPSRPSLQLRANSVDDEGDSDESTSPKERDA
jgi:hypothetical protein